MAGSEIVSCKEEKIIRSAKLSKILLSIPLYLLSLMICYGDDLIEQHVLESFSWLKSLGTIPNVYFDKNLAKVNQESIKSEYADRYVGEIKFAKDSSYLKVSTTLGPSHDPTAILEYEYENKKCITAIKTFALVIPGNGNIYSFADKHIYIGNQDKIKYLEKYEFVNGEFVIIDQPIFFINYKASAAEEITLYTEINSYHEVGKIPKNYPAYIIGIKFVNGRRFLLVQSKFGLVGWHELVVHDVNNTSINGICLSPD